MKKNILLLSAFLLLTGCGATSSSAASESSVPEPTIEPTPDPEVERMTRINDALHGETISELTTLISNGADASAYIERGDEYFKIAEQEDYYEAYDYANKDYIMAYALDGDLSNHKDILVKIYEAKAQHCLDENNIEDYEGYLTRANHLAPSSDRYALIVEARKKINQELANTEPRNDYHDLDGNLVSYTISKCGDDGLRTEVSTYTADDTLVDTYSDFEYDEYGNCLRSATFDNSTLKFVEERVDTYDDSGTLNETKFYDLSSKKFLGSQVMNYDALGRLSGYRFVDGNTGDDAGSVVYRYDENDQYYGYDVYDANGNLTYHENVDGD